MFDVNGELRDSVGLFVCLFVIGRNGGNLANVVASVLVAGFGILGSSGRLRCC